VPAELNGASVVSEQSSQTTTAPSRAKSDDDLVELDEVKVVSAAGYEQNIADAPASVFVITREELEKKSFNDLAEVLKNVPGISIVGSGTSKEIMIRGMHYMYTLYLIDGRPMSAGGEAHRISGGGVNPAASGNSLASLPPVSMIERIEVVRGPMSSLYGSEAMGGVINIITKKTPSEWTGTVKGEYTKAQSVTSSDSHLASANLAGPIIQDLLSLQTYGLISGADQSEYITLYQNRAFGAKTILAIDKANSAWVNYDYTKQESGSTLATSSVSQTFAAGHDLKLNKFDVSSYLQRAVRYKPSSSITYDVLTFNTQANYFFETNALTFGAQYKEEELDDNQGNFLPNKPDLLTRWSYSVFAEDEWNILGDLALVGGVRYNDSEAFRSNISPRVYAVYHIGDDLIVKGGVASGYKAPGLRQSADDFDSSKSATGMLIGNPNLRPESSVNYEISLAYNNKDIGLGADVTVYHTDYKDKLEIYTYCTASNGACSYNNLSGYNTIRFYRNLEKAQIEGLEASLRFSPIDRLALGGSYTYTDSEIRSGDNKGQPLNSVSKHMASANIDVKITERLSVWGQYAFTGSYKERSDITAATATKNRAYATGDIGAVIKFRDGLRFNVGVYNASNKKITEDTHYRFVEGRRLAIGFVSDF
jgi:outer membrane receptor for ferrienterochelin and colicins